MGAESNQILNPKGGPSSSVNPLFGGQWGAGGYYQPGTNTGGLSGSAPGDTPQFYNPPNQNNYGGGYAGPQTGPLQQPQGPITPVGGPQTGPMQTPQGPVTPAGNVPANINLGGAFPPNFLQNLFQGFFGGNTTGAPSKF